MITIRHASERGQSRYSWLESYHTFSFASYHDPRHMGFRDLRVINEDCVQPGGGFGTHSHRNMEIVSWVLSGVLEHKDSLDNGSLIRPGDVQRMTAGTGVTHSEYNHSCAEVVRFLQIWILPEQEGLKPSYEQKNFPEADRLNTLRLIASRNGVDGSVTVHQDASLYSSILDAGRSISHKPEPDRYLWLQLTRGAVTILGESLAQGDGAAISGEEIVKIRADQQAELLLFDLG
jgi:redox-sensitive bicupin YhaK (pirin superfamily)